MWYVRFLGEKIIPCIYSVLCRLAPSPITRLVWAGGRGSTESQNGWRLQVWTPQQQHRVCSAAAQWHRSPHTCYGHWVRAENINMNLWDLIISSGISQNGHQRQFASFVLSVSLFVEWNRVKNRERSSKIKNAMQNLWPDHRHGEVSVLRLFAGESEEWRQGGEGGSGVLLSRGVE